MHASQASALILKQFQLYLLTTIYCEVFGKINKNEKKCVTHIQRNRINQPGAVETAGDQGQGEGADPVLPKAERGGQSGEN